MNKSFEFVLIKEDGSPAIGEEMEINGRKHYADNNGKFRVIDESYIQYLMSQQKNK